MKDKIVEALILKYRGQIAEAEANIEIYLKNPVGIGEHSEILEAIHSQLIKISEAEDNIRSLMESCLLYTSPSPRDRG